MYRFSFCSLKVFHDRVDALLTTEFTRSMSRYPEEFIVIAASGRAMLAAEFVRHSRSAGIAERLELRTFDSDISDCKMF